MPCALQRRSKFASYCYDLISWRNYAKTMFYSSIWFKKIEYFNFSVVKMTANYAEIGRVVNLRQVFRQVPLVQISEMLTIILF